MSRLEKVIIFFLLIFFCFNIFKIIITLRSVMTYNLDGKNYRLLIADTPQEREKGLMYIKDLKGIDGMIFLFQDKEMRSFWNKNTYLDLDLYWISDDQIVGATFLPSMEKSKKIIMVYSPVPVNKIVELKK